MTSAETHTTRGLEIHNSYFVDEESAGREEPFEAFTMTYFSDRNDRGYTGQFGVNRFCKADGLKRHVHLSLDGKRFVRERIFIIDAALLLDVAGQKIVILPNTLCDIGPGVPHMWRGLAAGTLLPDGSRHSRESIMVFFYEEEVRGFEKVTNNELILDTDQLDDLRGDVAFPKMNQEEILSLPFIRNAELRYGAA